MVNISNAVELQLSGSLLTDSLHYPNLLQIPQLLGKLKTSIAYTHTCNPSIIRSFGETFEKLIANTTSIIWTSLLSKLIVCLQHVLNNQGSTELNSTNAVPFNLVPVLEGLLDITHYKGNMSLALDKQNYIHNFYLFELLLC